MSRISVKRNWWNYSLFLSNNFISNARLKLAKKNQARAKEHRETILFLCENYSLSSSTLSSKNNRWYSKKCTKTSATVHMRLYDLLISCHWSLLIPPWKHQKTSGFLMFSGVSKEISGMKWVNDNENET